ncbi:methyltransferase domain-containing protein [Nitrospira sp. M1]
MNIAEKMKREWNRRATHHAPFWVATENFHNDRQFKQSGEDTAKALLSRVAAYSSPSWTVLDIGCGIGRVLKPLASHFQQLVGIDVSGEMITQSKKWLDGLDNVETLETSGVDLQAFQDQSFDLVYSFVAFQHMPRPVFARYLEESHRVLNTHGYLAFQIPIGVSRDTALEDTISMRQYSTDELVKEFQRCGFQIIGENEINSSTQTRAKPNNIQPNHHHSHSAKMHIAHVEDTWNGSSRSMKLNTEFYLAKKAGDVIRKKNSNWLEIECVQAFSLLDTRMYIWFAEQCLDAGQNEEALRTYKILLEQDPDSLEKWTRTVEMLIQQRKFKEARITLEKLTAALPTYEALNTLLEAQKRDVQDRIIQI